MSAIKSLLLTTAVVGLVATMGLKSFADVLPPFPPPSGWTPGTAVYGETSMPVTGGTGNPLVIDWIVQAFDTDGDGKVDIWGYFYQIENASGTTVSSFTIVTPHHPSLLLVTLVMI